MPRQMQRSCLERGRRLDVYSIIRAAEMTAARAGREIVVKVNAGQDTPQLITLRSYPRHFGGVQWYFLCPLTGEKASVLYQPRGAKAFGCRKAWGRKVAYRSQYLMPEHRAEYEADKLCDKIGGPGASKDWDVPPKPKGMRWRTYRRLSERCESYRESAELERSNKLVRLVERLSARCGYQTDRQPTENRE